MPITPAYQCLKRSPRVFFSSLKSCEHALLSTFESSSTLFQHSFTVHCQQEPWSSVLLLYGNLAVHRAHYSYYTWVFSAPVTTSKSFPLPLPKTVSFSPSQTIFLMHLFKKPQLPPPSLNDFNSWLPATFFNITPVLILRDDAPNILAFQLLSHFINYHGHILDHTIANKWKPSIILISSILTSSSIFLTHSLSYIQLSAHLGPITSSPATRYLSSS